MIVVVAALIEKDECVLIARRSTGDDNLKGKWEFPGGKVNKDETEQSALKREIYEEFEIEIKVNEFVTNNIFEYPTKKIDLRLYKCSYVSGDVSLHDHSEYKFVRYSKLLDYDLAEADIPLAKFVKEQYDERKL